MKWISVEDERKPPVRRPVLLHCPDWCDSGYQVGYFNGKEFYFDEQPNDMFNDHVESWAIFLEAD